MIDRVNTDDKRFAFEPTRLTSASICQRPGLGLSSWPIALVMFALLLCCGGEAFAQDTKPNIVLIFIDDMGYADIEPFGNTLVRTPNLTRLAEEGRRFTNFYAAPVCTMLRTNLMTGCYNPRVSMPGVYFPGSQYGLNPDETTLAEIVKPQGYATACVGKWHLGDAPEFLPTRQGFDRYFGLPYSNDMVAGRKGKSGVMPPLPVIRGETTIETEPDQSQLTRRYTEEAIKFIREKKDQPFFVYLPHTMVHFPLAASADFKDKSQMGLIGDTIEEIDWSVGQILDTLDDLKLSDQTIVIFTSDNGPARREAPPFRGNKGTCLEGGVREPTIVRWPGHVPAGTTCDQICGTIDMLPTFATLVGTTLDPSRPIDGKDMLPLMTDEGATTKRDTHVYYNGAGKAVAIRQGNWKLIVQHPGGPSRASRGPDPGSTISKAMWGRADVASENPQVVKRLQSRLVELDREIHENQRPAGSLASR